MHEAYMHRCIQLAKAGLGRVSPNPMVGCVIVHNRTIIGEGFHQFAGGAHAERLAVHSVADKSLLPRSRMYISLEPCCHHGKTPPCTDLILECGIPEVYIGMTDPFDKVNGKSIRILETNGVKVHRTLEEAACRRLNKRFVTALEKKRPYIILKWAESRDGFIAPATQTASNRWISNSLSRTLVHQWRAEEDAVLVGARTAITDDPRLDVRMAKGRNPVRVVIDTKRNLPAGLRLFDGRMRTLVLTDGPRRGRKNVVYIPTDFSAFPEDAMKRLLGEGIQSVIVEGGAQTLRSYLDSGCWDEIRRFTGDVLLREGIRAPGATGSHHESRCIGSDVLDIFYR